MREITSLVHCHDKMDACFRTLAGFVEVSGLVNRMVTLELCTESAPALLVQSLLLDLCWKIMHRSSECWGTRFLV